MKKIILGILAFLIAPLQAILPRKKFKLEHAVSIKPHDHENRRTRDIITKDAPRFVSRQKRLALSTL